MSAHPPVHPQALLRLASEAYLVTPRAVLSRSRQPAVCRARQLTMLLLHQRCGWSVQTIGRKLHRDHSTVCYGLRRAAGREYEPDEQDAKALAYVARMLPVLRAGGEAAQNGRIPQPAHSRRSGGEVAAR